MRERGKEIERRKGERKERRKETKHLLISSHVSMFPPALKYHSHSCKTIGIPFIAQDQVQI